ncbi:MAG: response regulator [Betaproteobacteria bacterium]
MTKRILIVEDEDSIVASLEFLMQRKGFQTLVARDGISALECLATFRPDLVVLDVMLPGKSGHEVCRSLRTAPLHRDIPVVMLTAKGGIEDADEGMNSGADEYVVKPFSTRDLLARVTSLLAARDPR